MNTYSYVSGNPLYWSDPFGLTPDWAGAWKHCKEACAAKGQMVVQPISTTIFGVEIWGCKCDEKCKIDGYENPGHHDPSSGPNKYDPTKQKLPDNHEELWRNSRPDPRPGQGDLTRWTKEGTGKNANWHRFVNDRNGNWHWNGSTKGGPDGFGGWRKIPQLPKGVGNLWK